MLLAANDSRSGHVHGLSIRLRDGTSVPLDVVIAEGRRQQAREIRRLASAAAHRIAQIARTTARTLVSLVPAHESKRKIPGPMPMDESRAANNADNRSGNAVAFDAEGLPAGAEATSFQTDAVLGHLAAASAEGVAKDKRKIDDRPLAA